MKGLTMTNEALEELLMWAKTDVLDSTERLNEADENCLKAHSDWKKANAVRNKEDAKLRKATSAFNHIQSLIKEQNK